MKAPTPRGLNRRQAAEYVGLDLETFNAMVEDGTMPPMLDLGSVEDEVWDRYRLDAAADKAKLGVVYFIACEGYVKVGFSKGLADRLQALRTATPFEMRVLGRMAGDQQKERGTHAVLADYRVRGEWFRLEPEVEAYIRENCR